VTNAYPELPALAYRRTSVAMPDVVSYLQASGLPPEVKRSTYVIFRIESANGTAGVNNNYSGMQADGARWDASIDHYFVGTTVAPENATGASRTFLCFAKWEDSVACLADRLTARGVFVGGRTHYITKLDVTDATMLARVYTKEWAKGLADAEPSANAIGSFLSMYAQAVAAFPAPPVESAPTPAVTPDADAARLRAALTDIIARAQAALADQDDSADDLNAQVLATISGGHA
jgi:hypothetical protein